MPHAATPAFRLYLLRHAQSGWAMPGQGDFDRTLDETGLADAGRVAEMAADRRLAADLILCSTAVRCRQTAEPFQKSMGQDRAVTFLDGLYSGTAQTYRDIIASHANLGAVMVIGHNPMVHHTFEDMIGVPEASSAMPRGFSPGSLAVVDFDSPPDVHSLRGRLAHLLTPED